MKTESRFAAKFREWNFLPVEEQVSHSIRKHMYAEYEKTGRKIDRSEHPLCFRKTDYIIYVVDETGQSWVGLPHINLTELHFVDVCAVPELEKV